MKDTMILKKYWAKRLFFSSQFIKNNGLASSLLLFLFILLFPTDSWGQQVVYTKNISGTVYYRVGASSCDDVTTSHTAGNLEAAIYAAGVNGTCYICPGTYIGTQLDTDGTLHIKRTGQQIIGLGTVLIKAGGTAAHGINFLYGAASNARISNVSVEVQNLAVNNFGIYVDRYSEGVTVSGCTITCVANPTGGQWIGITTRAINTIITGNDVSLVEIGITVNHLAPGTIVSNNRIYDLKAGGDAHSDGITLGGGTLGDHTGTVISGNIIHGYKDDGIDLFWASNALVYGNEVYSGTNWSADVPDGNGIKCGGSPGSHGNKIIGNYVHDIGHKAAITSNGTNNHTIAYNLIVNNTSGIFGGIWVTTGSTGIMVYNNTVIMGTGGQHAIYVEPTSTATVMNNIFSKGTAINARDFMNSNQMVMGGYNILVNDASVHQNTNYTNTDSKDRYATNPMLDSNYRPLPGSPAINAGKFVGLTTDHAGNAVPYRTAPDIVAFESVGPRSPTNLRPLN